METESNSKSESKSERPIYRFNIVGFGFTTARLFTVAQPVTSSAVAIALAALDDNSWR